MVSVVPTAGQVTSGLSVQGGGVAAASCDRPVTVTLPGGSPDYSSFTASPQNLTAEQVSPRSGENSIGELPRTGERRSERHTGFRQIGQ